jgi:hypothetical protein
MEEQNESKDIREGEEGSDLNLMSHKKEQDSEGILREF